MSTYSIMLTGLIAHGTVGLLEAAGLVLLVIYVLNFWNGIRANEALALAFAREFESLLRDNFTSLRRSSVSVILSTATPGPAENEMADDTSAMPPMLTKDSWSEFRIYGTGRRNCKGALIALRLKRRQDLLSVVLDAVGQTRDVVMIEIPLQRTRTNKARFTFGVLRKADVDNALEDAVDLAMLARQFPLEFLPKEVRTDEAMPVPMSCSTKGFCLLDQLCA
jgi:hypothetical protein